MYFNKRLRNGRETIFGTPLYHKQFTSRQYLTKSGTFLQHSARRGRLTRVGHGTIGDYLHQKDTERPDVGLDGELAVHNRLRSGPLDGELGSCNAGRDHAHVVVNSLDNMHVQV